MKKLTILVVEDDPIIRNLTRIVLKKAGHRVAVAGNGMEALKTLAAEAHDIILLDMQMPVMDGFTTCRIIRQCEQGVNPGEHAELTKKLSAKNGRPTISIVAVTGNDMPYEQQRCLEAGMDECLVKPFSMDQFSAALSRINKDFGQPRNRGGTKKQPVENSPGFSPATLDKIHAPGLSPATLDKIHAPGFSPATLDKILRTLYRLPREKMIALRKSLEKALRRDLSLVNQALQQGKMPHLSAAAHRLRGTLLILRQDSWAEKVLHLEIKAGNNTEPEDLTRAVADLTRAFSPFLEKKQP